MSIVTPRVWLLTLFLGLQFCSGTTPDSTRAENEQTAKTIATEAFLKDTKHAITEYSVRPCKHSSTEWCFFFQGEKQFFRPGFHWLVTINRATGEVRVDEGL
jgi:hypothetical protein